MATASPAPRPVRRWPGVVVTLVLVLAMGVAAAEFFGRGWAEARAADRLQAALGTPERPEVSIESGLFLWQAAQQRFDRVVVRAADADAGVPVDELDITLSGLRADWSLESAVAERADGHATLAWSRIGREVDADVSFLAPDRMRSVRSIDVLGFEVAVEIRAKPGLDVKRQQVDLVEPELDFGSVEIPGDVSAPIIDRLIQPMELPLPAALHGTELTATEAGLRLSFTGDSVDLLALR